MKKLLTLSLFLMGSLSALPLVNPADSSTYTNGVWAEDCFAKDCWLENFSMRLGFYGDYVFNRNLEIRDPLGNAPGTTTFPADGDFRTVSMSTNAGIVLFNFCDWIEAYATFGVTNMAIRAESGIFTIHSAATQFDAELLWSPSVSYTVGADAPIWQSGCFTLGDQAQYFYTNPSASRLWAYDAGVVAAFTNDHAKYTEYQGAIAASWAFEDWANLSMIPFIGIQFSGVSWNLNTLDPITNNSNVFGLPKAHQQQVVGWTIGSSMILCDLIGVTAEARFANEKALFVNGQVRF